MSILKELICTSTIILLVQGAPLLFQAFTYCIISKPSICDISQHSYISKERVATYSYYGTLQVSKYKVTILFSRSSCIKCKAFLYGTTAIATTLYAPCIRGIIGYYSAYIYKSPPICKAPVQPVSELHRTKPSAICHCSVWYGLIIARFLLFVK